MLQPVYHLPWEKGRVVSTRGMLLTGRGYCDIPESYFEKLQKSRKWLLFTKVQVAHSYCLYSSLFQTTVVRLITHAEMLCSRCSQGGCRSRFLSSSLVCAAHCGEHVWVTKLQGYSALIQSTTYMVVCGLHQISFGKREFSWSSLMCN